MKKLLTILFLLPTICNAQPVISDTEYYGTAPNWVKVVSYRNVNTTVFTTAAKLQIKTDSLATALATATAGTYATIATMNTKQNTITVLPFANGGISGASATPATTGVMTVNMTSSVITITPTGACTFNASGGVAGQIVTFSITTSGTTSRVLTFGANFRKTGTLATGTVSARFFAITFRCIDGTIWQEISRTVAQT